MSGAATWLHNQRKTELTEIAQRTGLKDYSDLKKSDLENALDAHLRTNRTTLHKDSGLTEYYKRVGAETPAKDVVATGKANAKNVARRTTKAKDEIEAAASGTITAVVARTPKQKQLVPANIPLPPSPAVVAHHIDRQTQRVRSRLSKAYKQSGLMEFNDNIRDTVSSTQSIELLAIFLELYGLRAELMPMKYLTTVALPITIMDTNELTISLPYVFTVITAKFWTILTLWSLTSAILPLGFAYFFNLALKNKHGHIKSTKQVPSSAQYDHLTFNIAKAVITYLVYSQNFKVFSYPHRSTRQLVESLVPGGSQTMLVASGIGILTSLYEAVLRK